MLYKIYYTICLFKKCNFNIEYFFKYVMDYICLLVIIPKKTTGVTDKHVLE